MAELALARNYTSRLLEALATKERYIFTPTHLQKVLGASKGYVSKLLDELERERIILSRRVGRERRVSINSKSRRGKEVLRHFTGRRGAEDGPAPSRADLYCYKGVVARVVDGDTVDVDVDVGFKMKTYRRFRLAGINTAEIHGVAKGTASFKKGMEAKELLVDLILGKEVILRSKKTGMYGRWLAEVWHRGVSVNQLLLDRGLAVRYR